MASFPFSNSPRIHKTQTVPQLTTKKHNATHPKMGTITIFGLLFATTFLIFVGCVWGESYGFIPEQPYRPRPIRHLRDCVIRYPSPQSSVQGQGDVPGPRGGSVHGGWSSLMDDEQPLEPFPNHPPTDPGPFLPNLPLSNYPCNPASDRNCESHPDDNDRGRNAPPTQPLPVPGGGGSYPALSTDDLRDSQDQDNRPPSTIPPESGFSPISYQENFDDNQPSPPTPHPSQGQGQGHGQEETEGQKEEGQSPSGYGIEDDDAAEVLRNRELPTTPSTTPTAPPITQTPQAIVTSTQPSTTTPSPTSIPDPAGFKNEDGQPPSSVSLGGFGGYPSSQGDDDGAEERNGDRGPHSEINVPVPSEEDSNYYPRFIQEPEEEQGKGTSYHGGEGGLSLEPQEGSYYAGSQPPPHPQPQESTDPQGQVGGRDADGNEQEQEAHAPPLPHSKTVQEDDPTSPDIDLPGESPYSPPPPSVSTGESGGGGGWSSPSNPPDQGDVYDAQFAKEVLDTINFYRARHRAPPLLLSHELNKVAQYLAFGFGSGAPLTHSQDFLLGDYGESIRVIGGGGGGGLSGSQAIAPWYSQHLNFDYSDPQVTSSNEDFTAIVWVGSRQLGVGKVKGADGRTFIVTTYFPPPNNPSKVKDNVHPPFNQNRATY